MPDQAPQADSLLAELQREGAAAAPLGLYGQKVSPEYESIKRRTVVQAAGGGPIRGISRVRYTHEDCIDRILTSPGIAQDELAQIYGVTAQWMSIVVNCDAFKVALAARREELIDPVLAATLNERFGALAVRSVDVLLAKLAQPVEKISDKLALEAAALGARATGMGESQSAGGPNAVDHLAALAHRLVDLNRPPPPTIEMEPS